VFAFDDPETVAGNVIPEPEAEAVAPPTPIVVAKDGVVNVANVADVAGSVKVVVPATAGAAKVTEPLVSPDITMLAIMYSLNYNPT
jgi:hypothetical protein